MKKTIKLHRKEYEIKAAPKSHHVDYEIYEENDCCNPHEPVKPIISGFVKWDGCSNWDFPSTKDCMFHGCERSDLTDFGELMAICHDMTCELCENADSDLFLPQNDEVEQHCSD